MSTAVDVDACLSAPATIPSSERRRVRAFLLARSDLAQVLAHWSACRAEAGLPLDARVVRINPAFGYADVDLALVVWSASYPPVPELAPFPLGGRLRFAREPEPEPEPKPTLSLSPSPCWGNE